MKTAQCLLGAHVSIAGGMPKAIERGLALKCTAIQVFTKNASQWNAKPRDPEESRAFRVAAEQAGLMVVAHDSYLINLASPDKELRQKSEQALIDEMTRASDLGIGDMVIHPGAHTGSGENAGIRAVASSLNRVFRATEETGGRVVLENTAGQGSALGHRLEHLAEIIEASDYPERTAVCFDTCHAFAAGYDLRTESSCRSVLRELDRLVGLDRIAVIHMNDCKRELGARVDRHEHLGRGAIGLECFRFFMKLQDFRHVPKIIETPKNLEGIDMDPVNLGVLRGFLEE
jgi:deoxyribonuclease-4